MVCSICKKTLVKKIKTKKGRICPDCFARLPDAVKYSVESFTPKQLAEIIKICHPHTEQARLKINRLHVCDHSIHVNNWEIGIKDIQNLSLNFHPTRPGEVSGVCYGYITVVVEIKNPHILIEEPFNDHEILIKYQINGRNITYLYKSDVNQIISKVQDALRSNEDSFIKAIILFTDEKRKQSQSYGSRSSNRQQSTYENKTNKSEPSSPFADAKKMFGVEVPYTKQTLDQRKKALLMKWHPDHNVGNEKLATEMTTLILKNYNLLLKQAD